MSFVDDDDALKPYGILRQMVEHDLGRPLTDEEMESVARLLGVPARVLRPPDPALLSTQVAEREGGS